MKSSRFSKRAPLNHTAGPRLLLSPTNRPSHSGPPTSMVPNWPPNSTVTATVPFTRMKLLNAQPISSFGFVGSFAGPLQAQARLCSVRIPSEVTVPGAQSKIPNPDASSFLWRFLRLTGFGNWSRKEARCSRSNRLRVGGMDAGSFSSTPLWGYFPASLLIQWFLFLGELCLGLLCDLQQNKIQLVLR